MTDYFYAPPSQIRGNEILIEGDEFAHLVHVMRKKEGDAICVVDGRGTAYDAEITVINRKIAHCTIAGKHERHHESSRDVTLAVAVLKNPSKFDFLVEKATEIGVRRIVPLLTARTIPHHAKAERWRKLALSAMKQSGRSVLPEVLELASFGEFVGGAASSETKIVIAHEQPFGPEEPGFESLGSGVPVTILVGPEGGFTDEEVKECLRLGALPVYLGERRLRTETAAIVMAALALIPARG
jgi:16S rRNA (uracil1498-N3)-methyltransferase